jgi:hypothetical protein
VAADDDGLSPSWDGSRNALKDDWLAEDGATEDVADLRESHVSMKKAGVIGTGVCLRCHWESATSPST